MKNSFQGLGIVVVIVVCCIVIYHLFTILFLYFLPNFLWNVFSTCVCSILFPTIDEEMVDEDED
jgi:hypothetical protein